MNETINNLCVNILEKSKSNYSHFEEMLKITQQLEEKLPSGDVELCNKILEQRQQLINKIELVNKEIHLFQNEINSIIKLEDFSLESVQPHISKDLYETVINLNTKIQTIIEQIQTLDKEHFRNAEMAIEETKLQLLRVHSTLRPNQSYQRAPMSEPKFVDKKR
jgi:hypothetical protein